MGSSGVSEPSGGVNRSPLRQSPRMQNVDGRTKATIRWAKETHVGLAVVLEVDLAVEADRSGESRSLLAHVDDMVKLAERLCLLGRLSSSRGREEGAQTVDPGHCSSIRSV